MRLWQLNVKIRKTLDRMGWPLVTRKRFMTLHDNMQAEITFLENGLNNTRQALLTTRSDLKTAHETIDRLRAELVEARKNDNRDPATGQYIKS